MGGGCELARSQGQPGCCRHSPASENQWIPSTSVRRCADPANRGTCCASATMREACRSQSGEGRPAAVQRKRDHSDLFIDPVHLLGSVSIQSKSAANGSLGPRGAPDCCSAAAAGATSPSTRPHQLLNHPSQARQLYQCACEFGGTHIVPVPALGQSCAARARGAHRSRLEPWRHCRRRSARVVQAT